MPCSSNRTQLLENFNSWTFISAIHMQETHLAQKRPVVKTSITWPICSCEKASLKAVSLWVIHQLLFINLFHAKCVGPWHRWSTLFFIKQISSYLFTSFSFLGSMMHRIHGNTVIAMNYLHSAVNFSWSPFSQQLPWTEVKGHMLKTTSVSSISVYLLETYNIQPLYIFSWTKLHLLINRHWKG